MRGGEAAVDASSRGQTAILPRGSGLPCRVVGIRCDVVFHPEADTVAAIMIAARARNYHELRIHGYAHVEREVLKPDYTQARLYSRMTTLRRRHELANG